MALLLPLVVWELIVRKMFFTAGWNIPTISDVVTTLTHPGLWFLLTLFRICVLYGIYQYFCERYNAEKKIWKDIVLLVPVLMLSGGIDIQVYHLDNTYLYTLFYYLGVFIVRHNTLNRMFYSQAVYAISFFLFCILSCHWTINGVAMGHNDIMKIVIAMCAFVIAMNACKRYENSIIARQLCLFGVYSMEVYVAHWTFLELTQGQFLDVESINGFWILVCAIILALPIIYLCIIFSKAVECSPVLRQAMFGRRK